MEQHIDLYQDNPLFTGVEETSLLPLLQCLQAKKSTYTKGTTIFAAGEQVTKLGIVLAGRINTLYEDVLGGRSIISSINPGQLFCDAFCCTKDQYLPVHVVAQTDCVVLLIDVDLILHTCPHACRQHQLLGENLVHMLAEKYVTLNQKMVHLSGRTTRRKLLSYLFEQAKLADGRPFAIPFTQQELADYLFIDRSGLSTELNRLKKEGILELDNGMFTLHLAPCAGNDCDN